MTELSKLKRFVVSIISAQIVVMLAWAVFSIGYDGHSTLESFLAFSALSFLFLLVGSSLIGLPILRLATQRGWDKSIKKFVLFGSVTGGASVILLTFLFFFYGPEVAWALMKFVVPLGLMAGGAAATVWFELSKRGSL